MDAFFVGVYLLDHPDDRGKAVATGGSPSGRGVVTSASYEARAYGVRSAMPARRALRLCPKLKLVNADWKRIHECSRQVFAILERYGPTQRTSVDEAYVDLSESASPDAFAVQIRESVVAETGLAASVGLATSKLVAKVASDHGKPGGCVVVGPGREEAFLAPLPVRVITGIGPRTAERLADLGIHTCEDLANADTTVLAAHLGQHAERLPERARGRGSRSVWTGRWVPKSISSERTFPCDVSGREELLQQIDALSERIGKRLRRHELVARTVFVKLRWSDFTTFTRRRSVAVPIDADGEIAAVASALWQANWPAHRRVRLIGVGVGGLEPAGARQLRLDLG